MLLDTVVFNYPLKTAENYRDFQRTAANIPSLLHGEHATVLHFWDRCKVDKETTHCLDQTKRGKLGRVEFVKELPTAFGDGFLHECSTSHFYSLKRALRVHDAIQHSTGIVMVTHCIENNFAKTVEDLTGITQKINFDLSQKDNVSAAAAAKDAKS